MEQYPKKNKNLANPDLQDAVKESRENVKLIQEQLNNSLKELAWLVAYFKELQYHIETMQEVMQEDKKLDKFLGIKPGKGTGKFNSRDVEEVKQKMIEVENKIKDANRDISEWILNKGVLNAQIEEFKQLEESFRNLLLKIKPEELQ